MKTKIIYVRNMNMLKEDRGNRDPGSKYISNLLSRKVPIILFDYIYSFFSSKVNLTFYEVPDSKQMQRYLIL